MELVAEAPQIKHLSVVCTAPDGRVFVAEDPMDIRVNADATQGRILCLHTDGHWTVFAEGLHAVFGMQYLEGQLYVVHNPQFSVFEDHDGVGANRRELIAQTNPKPWALDWNDHVPANFKLAMDGFFYWAVGDKGLYQARGTDGREINLHGGGVVRMRPDGSDLEIFSHGVRNILDVAINDEDDIFTYDNTDEHDWMGRVTHMVEGGFYGYPHDFIPRRPYTLWMMDDLGGGAACGTLCYNEDALPAEYHGNLFLSDFGQRQINRLVIERSGATYRVAKREKMFPSPPADFRPVGIAWSADGLSIYICDWQHRDEKEDVDVGRLWKLTWDGESNATAKPSWFAAAASNQSFQATDDDLLRALSHPSRAVRLTAQRRLIDRVKLITDESERDRELQLFVGKLVSPAEDDRLRRHLIWTLDAIDEGRRARNEIINVAANKGSTSVRLQAIRQLALRRALSAVPALQVGPFNDDSAVIRAAAVIALGRIPAIQNVSPLRPMLDDPDAVVRFNAFTALNRIGRALPETWSQISLGLRDDNERIREGTRFAMRDTYDPELVKVLTDLVRPRITDVQVRRTALELLAAIHHQSPAWKGEWWAYHPALQPSPEKTATWEATPQILTALLDALTDDDTEIRRIALAAELSARDKRAASIIRQLFTREIDPKNHELELALLGVLRDTASASLVAATLRGPSSTDLQKQALATAAQLGGEQIENAIVELLRANQADKPVLANAMETLGTLKATGAVDSLTPFLRAQDPELRRTALAAMTKMDPDRALAAIKDLLGSAESGLRGSAVIALAQFRRDEATDLLLQAVSDPATRIEAIRGLAARPNLKSLPAYLSGIQDSDATLREASRQALEAIHRDAWPAIEPHLPEVNSTGLSVLKKIFHDDARARRFFSNVPDILEPEEYLAYAIRQNGDSEEGRRLFGDATGLACISCHRVGGSGKSIGPDLSNVGAQFSRYEIAESILYPNKVVREGYQTVDIETTDGESISGLPKGEDATHVFLLDRNGNLQKIAIADVNSSRKSPFSLMPEGLYSSLTLEQFAGLVSYLSAQKATTNEP